jgi:hypothetical protein
VPAAQSLNKLWSEPKSGIFRWSETDFYLVGRPSRLKIIKYSPRRHQNRTPRENHANRSDGQLPNSASSRGIWKKPGVVELGRYCVTVA